MRSEYTPLAYISLSGAFEEITHELPVFHDKAYELQQVYRPVSSHALPLSVVPWSHFPQKKNVAIVRAFFGWAVPFQRETFFRGARPFKIVAITVSEDIEMSNVKVVAKGIGNK